MTRDITEDFETGRTRQGFNENGVRFQWSMFSLLSEVPLGLSDGCHCSLMRMHEVHLPVVEYERFLDDPILYARTPYQERFEVQSSK